MTAASTLLQGDAQRDVTVLARHAVSASRLPMRLAAGPQAASQTTQTVDDERQQIPTSKTILAH